MLCGILSAFFSGCCLNTQPQIVTNPNLTWEISQLQKIATALGCPSRHSSQQDMQELITDIKIRLNETDEYHGRLLSENEKQQIKDLLYGEDQILKTLASYDLFIQKINHRQIIVLPEEAW